MYKILKVCKKHGPLDKKQVYGYFDQCGRQAYQCRQCQLAYKKKYAKEYPEVGRERHKKWYRKNKQKHNEKKTKWRIKNESRYNSYQRAFYALKKGNPQLMRLYKEKYGKNNNH